MQREVAVEVETTSRWAPEASEAANCRADWRVIDRALRAIAQRRAALDAEEARWLREAERCKLWRQLGMVSALDYMERVLGYAPRTALDRLRVARALGTLPRLTEALTQGALPFSAVRELTRVATPATEAAWCNAASGKNLRQIEELVADHRPGDRPEDPGDPEARTRVVRFELSAETFSLLRQARTVLNDEHGGHLTDDQLVAALCSAALDGAVASEPTGRARFQIAITVCERCRQGWQDGAGARIAIGAPAVERAMCDAQHIGSLDRSGPERAYQDISPSVARLVWRRDGGRCRLPGCRSARGLEIHHIVHRSDGGTHDALNLILTCSSCHSAHHGGLLAIAGTADHLEVRRTGPQAPNDRADAHVGAATGTSFGETSGAGARSSTMCVDEHARSTSPSAYVGASSDAAPDEHARSTSPSAHVGASSDAAPDEHARSTSPSAHVGASGDANCDEEFDTASLAICTGGHVSALGNTDLEEVQRFASPSTRARTAADTNAAAAITLGAVPSKLDTAVLRTQAKQALVGLGWRPAVANAAVVAAMAALGAEAPLERLIFEALRRCPRPTA